MAPGVLRMTGKNGEPVASPVRRENASGDLSLKQAALAWARTARFDR